MAQEFGDVAELLEAVKPDEPVYAVRPHILRQTASDFIDRFPGDVLYAVKANPHLDFLRALYAGGIRHFDVASLSELKLIKEHFPAAHVYFMHPVKSVTAIREAAHRFDVSHFTVDHPDELAKIIIHTLPRKPTVIIRVAMPKGMAVYDLDGKFGCSAAEAIALVKAAAAEGLGVGLSFHVGSQCLYPSSYRKALDLVDDVIRATKLQPELIDIGGGFPVVYRNTNPPPLEEYIDAVHDGISQIKLHHPMQLLCEPGRALAASGASLIAKVELRRGNQLYLNDGVYGGISELRFNGLDVPMRAWRVNGSTGIVGGGHDLFRFCGPTCDSADILAGPFPLPGDIRMGDYIEFGQMGAYSMSMRSAFNGFQSAQHLIVNDQPLLP